jgi:hypothetical protein
VSKHYSPEDVEQELMRLLKKLQQDQERERGLPPGSLDAPFRAFLPLMRGLPNEPDIAPTTAAPAARRRSNL